MQKKRVWTVSLATAAALGLGGASVAFAVSAPSDGGSTEGPSSDSAVEHASGEQPLSVSDLEQAIDAALAEAGPGTVTSAESSDDSGSAYELEVALENGDEVEVELDESFTVVHVDDPEAADEDETPPADVELVRAAEAALTEAGAGTLSGVETSDDAGSGYEAEIQLDNGDEVDVELNEGFNVTHVESEDEESEDDD